MTAAYVVFVVALGALWRRCKGGAAPGWAATATMPLLSTLAAAPLMPVIGLWVVPLAVWHYWHSATFLLIESNNGGNGDPIGRYAVFGLGYLVPPAWTPEVRLLGWRLVQRGAHTEMGELWLGGSWFGFWAALAAVVADVLQ